MLSLGDVSELLNTTETQGSVKMVRSETDKAFKEENTVSLEFLERTTGFPKEFIKSELILGEEQINLDELRIRMLNYLEQANLEQMAIGS